MPTNNFKLFDEKKANMMTDEEYAINQQRLNGVQSGVASSQLQNKTLYQTALMCYALAQLMAANGYDANDADAVSTFVNNLSMSVLQKAVDKASAADITNKVANKWVDAKQLGELKTDVADNYLPLLGGTMLGDLILHGDPVSSLQAATKQYVDGKDLLLYTGQYTGTGTYGANNPTTLTFPFEPIIIFMPAYLSSDNRGWDVIQNNMIQQSYYLFCNTFASGDCFIKKSADNKTILLYSTQSESYQYNKKGYLYYFAAIGGYDLGGGTEWIVNRSGTWTVPRTGRYYIELYGMGGAGKYLYDNYASGGCSCQSYDNVKMTKGNSIAVVIGSSSSSKTSFGSKSVDNAGSATNSTTPGKGTGNLGADGVASSGGFAENYGKGVLSKTYGVGGGNVGGPGAVYIKYLGE